MKLLACLPAIATVLWTSMGSAHHVAVERGGTYVGGSFRWISSGGELFENSAGDRLSQIELTPVFGYFLTDGLGLGAAVGFTRVSQGDDSFYNLGLGPQLTYFFDTGGDALPFVTGGFLVRTVDFLGDSETGYGFVLGGGVQILASEHLGVGIGVGYAYDHFDISLFSPDGNGGSSFDGNHIATTVGLTGFLH